VTAADPDMVIAVARSWLGTPYHDQASLKGVGCDCLGLARGVWREVVGLEPFPIPPYSRDWGESGPREVLAEGARRMMPEIAPGDASPGALILFRMMPRAIAKHVGIVTGATTTGVTKTVNLGTGGASGSTTVVNIGSATAGAGGTTVVNTPTVTFANAVTQVGMPQANLTAQLLGVGGATADSYNRVSVNTPALLFNNAGAGIEATVNKAAAGNDAAFAFKTGFSARALIGLLGNDDFSLKVSPDGSAFFDAIKVDRTNGQVELPQPTILPGLNAAPSPPPTGKAAVYARNRAGAPWIDVMRPSGRNFPLQPHFGVNRIAN
jgi:NlpC/P60 family putative phage cell wall peptidase